MDNTFQTTFERHEKKYLLDERQSRLIERYLARVMTEDRHSGELVYSMYYDTPDHRIVERSLEKPLYKQKLRIRRYGKDQGAEGVAFVEIKKKFRGAGYKRRVPMTMQAAREYLAGLSYESATRRHPLSVGGQVLDGDGTYAQTLAEIDYARRRLGVIEPAMEIVAWRTAFSDARPDGLRVTLDRRICWRIPRRRNPRVDGPVAGPVQERGLLLADDETLMEVKAPAAMPLRFVRLLSALEVRPTSFSKYGSAYRLAYDSPDASSGVARPSWAETQALQEC